MNSHVLLNDEDPLIEFEQDIAQEVPLYTVICKLKKKFIFQFTYEAHQVTLSYSTSITSDNKTSLDS